jgi:hypothetical protein
LRHGSAVATSTPRRGIESKDESGSWFVGKRDSYLITRVRSREPLWCPFSPHFAQRGVDRANVGVGLSPHRRCAGRRTVSTSTDVVPLS